jgi:hypothetical protein
MNCPFYGRSLIVQPEALRTVQTNMPPFILLDMLGNRCALIVTSHSPCQMELAGRQPDWKTCPLVQDIRV